MRRILVSPLALAALFDRLGSPVKRHITIANASHSREVQAFLEE
ncbi:MAG TPA: hypothetical protein VFN71_09755 [Methylomirabilota bacterium]|nr:hypothetical protein [Methylomirabilota bacterium]